MNKDKPYLKIFDLFKDIDFDIELSADDLLDKIKGIRSGNWYLSRRANFEQSHRIEQTFIKGKWVYIDYKTELKLYSKDLLLPILEGVIKGCIEENYNIKIVRRMD